VKSTGTSPSNRRLWIRRALLALGAVVLAFLGLYVWALLSTGSSTLARALVWREAVGLDNDGWLGLFRDLSAQLSD
jgi:hypothetical protein